ncbi:MAG TPA: hypothetical protein VK797_13945 [Tepidisphaeraceae bacterium]|nr:hypothetical protein [Tepidisphaeraceae bacterium]
MFQASSPPLRVAPSPPLPTAYCPETDDETIAEINAALRRDAKPTTRRRRGTVGYRRDNADGRAALVPAADLPIGRLPRSSNQATPKKRK